jgi:hypothetical protein
MVVGGANRPLYVAVWNILAFSSGMFSSVFYGVQIRLPVARKVLVRRTSNAA